MRKILQKLGLNPDNSIVIGSGILEALGIRKAKDIDLVVTQEIYNSLKKSGKFIVSKKHSNFLLKKDILEIGSYWYIFGKDYKFKDLKNNSTVIDGIRYNSLDFLHKVKISWAKSGDAAAKDIRDIKLIEKYKKINQK